MPVAMLFLVLISWAAYSNSFHADFSLDNALVIKEDYRLREWTPENRVLIFTQNYWFPSFPSELYRPLTTITYAMNWSLFGGGSDPFGYHVVNLVLHMLNAILVLIVARRLIGRPWLALLAAAIFALHPVETESVINVVGRGDELACLWMLTGFWCYLRSSATKETARVAWLIGLGLAALLAMFSKESGIMLVALLPLYDFLFRWPKLIGSLGQRIGTAIYEFGLKGYVALVPAVVTFFVVRKMLFVASPIYGELFIDNPIARPLPHDAVGLAEKLHWWFVGEMTAFKVLGRYLALLVYPGTLSCDYSYNQIPLYGEHSSLWEDAQCWLALGIVAALIFYAFRLYRKQPLFTFGVLFFFGMMMPTANILKPIGSIMGERFLYFPSIGFCLIAALALRPLGDWLAAQIVPPSRARAWAGLVLPALILLALGTRTYFRNQDWATEFSLWKSAVAAAPDSFKVHKGFANGYWNRDANALLADGKPDMAKREHGLDDAIISAEKGLAVINAGQLSVERQDNTLFCDLGMYYNLKGDFLTQRKQPAEAAVFYQKGVDVMLRAREVDTWVNQASHQAQLNRGRKPEEIPDVGNPRVHNQLAASYLGLRQFDQAIQSATYAIHLAPLQPLPYLLLSSAQAARGDLDHAAVSMVTHLMLQDNANAWAFLRQIYTTGGQASAVTEVNTPTGKHLQLDPKNSLVRDHLTRAAAGLIQALIDAKQFGDAQIFRDRAIAPNDRGGYNLPADRMPVVPITTATTTDPTWLHRWFGWLGL